MIEKLVEFVVGEREFIALFKIVEGGEKLGGSVADGGESDDFGGEELLGRADGSFKIRETDLVIAGFEVFHLDDGVSESLGHGDFFGTFGFVVGGRHREFLERAGDLNCFDDVIGGWLVGGFGNGAHSFDNFLWIGLGFWFGEKDDFGLQDFEMESGMEAEASLFDFEFRFDSIVEDVESAREIAAFNHETFERGGVASDGEGFFAKVGAAFDSDIKVVFGGRSDADGGIGGGGIFWLVFCDVWWCCGWTLVVGDAGGDDFGVGEVDLAGFQEGAGGTGEFRGTDVPGSIAGSLEGGAVDFVGGDTSATTDVDGGEVDVATANVAGETDAVASDDFAGEVDDEAVGDAEVGRDEDAVGVGGEEANAFVDGEGGVGGHADADSAKNADGTTARAHGEDFAFAGQGDFAATNIEDAGARVSFFGNDVIAVEVDGDIVVNQNVVRDDNVGAEGDLDSFSLEGGDELGVGLDGVDVESGVFDAVAAEGLVGGGEVRAGEDDGFDVVEVGGHRGVVCSIGCACAARGVERRHAKPPSLGIF